MKLVYKTLRLAVVMCGLFVLLLGMRTFASDDNSLADLGIATEGAAVTPDFSYDTWTYDVTVPAGTTELSLSPTPSSSSASIAEITGTTLNEDGTGTVYIKVRAESGAEFTYTLNVTSAGEAPAAVPQTEAPAPVTEAPAQTEAPAPATEAPVQTEPQTEDSRFVRVDRNTIQEAENTITNLKSDIARYRDTISLYTRIMYGLIAVAVILLFIVINLILRKRDLKAELNDYRSLSPKKGKSQGRGPAPQRAGAPQAGGGRPQSQGTGMPSQAGRGRNNGGRPQTQGQVQGQGQGFQGGIPADGPQGQVAGQMRSGQIQYRAPGALDVKPQTSTHRKLPSYQKEGAEAAGGVPGQTGSQAGREPAAPGGAQGANPGGQTEAGGVPSGAPSGAAAGSGAQAEPGKSGASGNVEVDMIEL